MPDPGARQSWVSWAIREGTNATSALRLFRYRGGRIASQTWYRLYGQAQLEGVMASKEAGRPMNRAPLAGDIQTATSRRATGYMQRVVVMGRDKDGLVISRDVSLRGDTLLTRQKAVEKALGLVASGMEDEETRDRYPMTALLGGFYTGTYEFQPE